MTRREILAQLPKPTNSSATYYRETGGWAGAVRTQQGTWAGFNDLRVLPKNNDAFRQRWQGPPSVAIQRAMRNPQTDL